MLVSIAIAQLLSVVAEADTNHTATVTGSVNPKIVGGVIATEKEFPFLIFLSPCQKPKSGEAEGECQICGGALIERNWILTAGHCIAPLKDQKHVEVHFGKHKTAEDPESQTKVEVKHVYLHKDYKTDSSNRVFNDIALIKIGEGVHGVKTFPELAKTMPADNTLLTVAGWGKESDDADTASSILNKVELPIVPDATCIKWMGKDNFEPTKTFCAGFEEGKKDACQGDSGGPTFTTSGGKVTIQGIVSFGSGCALKMSPGVYTSVPHYRSWVLGVMDGSVKAENLNDGTGGSGATTAATVTKGQKECDALSQMLGTCGSEKMSSSLLLVFVVMGMMM